MPDTHDTEHAPQRNVAQNPAQREWLPHQSAFILEKSPQPVLMDGGFGAAKTDALCMGAYLDAELYPNNLILVGRQEYTDLADSTIKSFFSLPYVVKSAATWNEGRATYRHHNGSEILFRHLDDDAGLKNLNLGAAYIDQAEETLPERFDLLLGRLRRPNSSRKMRLTANPNGHDWLWQMFYGPGSVIWRSPHVEEFYTASPDYREGYRVIRCSTLDNPHLPADYVARLLKDYPVEFIEQYVKGSREVMLGYRFFDPLALRQQIVCEPIEVLGKPGIGYFVDGLPTPEWRPQEGGPVRLYELRDERDLYVIGLDIATGEGTSRCAGVARNCRMNRVAAVIDADLRPDELAVQGWLMSRYYGNALIAPERNGLGFSVVSALQQLTSNLFSEQVTEFGIGRNTGHLGWLTDAKSRMELFAQLQREIAGRSIELRDRELIEQCKAITMIHGKPKAEAGFRDDLVIALGISGMVRKLRSSLSQQTTAPTYQQAQPNTARPEGWAEGGVHGFGRGKVKVAGR
jgi:hypothetical protein